VSDIATSIELPVRSVDMDADRVVNNAVYFMYFEQARLAHLRRLGVIRQPRPPEELARSFTMPPPRPASSPPRDIPRYCG